MHLVCWSRFVNPSLQSCYKANNDHQCISHVGRACFVNPSLQYCYKASVKSCTQSSCSGNRNKRLACLRCTFQPQSWKCASKRHANRLFRFQKPFVWGNIRLEQTICCIFSKGMYRSPNRVLTPLKSASKRHARSFVPSSKSSFGEHEFGSEGPLQTREMHGWSSDVFVVTMGTKDEMRCFEVLLRSVITRFGLRTIEMSIENPHFIFCSSFVTRRLGCIKLIGQTSKVLLGLCKRCEQPLSLILGSVHTESWMMRLSRWRVVQKMLDELSFVQQNLDRIFRSCMSPCT